MRLYLVLLCTVTFFAASAQNKTSKKGASDPITAKTTDSSTIDKYFKPLKWRNIGPFRGGRSVTATGVTDNPLVYYMGVTGGGVWKTEDAGLNWLPISDGYFKTGSVGAITVAESDQNIVYVGMGEHAPRGVMSSYGDGMYKSTDAGKTWKKLGLELTRHIAAIAVHPRNPDIVYVAAQGAIHGATEDRGIYKSTDGGINWKKVLYVDENTGCADLSMDMNNPLILYASMWDYRRLPWQVQSGGKGSGLYKSTDGGETWNKIEKGLPKELGKIGVAVSRANSNKVYAVVESDTQKEQGGLFVSDDAGKNWSRVSKDHRLVQRAWYYIKITADPQNENIVYVFNSPGLKSIDGGKTWTNIRGTHGDYHQLWINPKNNQDMIIANDGGAAISFNAGKSWSTQNNQTTGQYYRIATDNLFPYNIYAGQQDNSSVFITSRNTNGYSIGEKDWGYSAGGESAFIALDPDNPKYIMGGSYQGTIDVLDRDTKESKPMMVAPIQYQSLQPKDMKYRFNWNAPILCSPHDGNTFYHAGNILFKTTDHGIHWQPISPDLTKHDTTKMGMSGVPYTNEGAGGENYCTIAYVTESPFEKGVIWTGSDDGLVYLTKDGGKTWANVTPAGLDESLVNCIEVSPHDKATAYIATTRYKFNDYTPSIYKTTDYGKSWKKISNGIPYGAYTRCVREDDVQKGLLYAGTETGFYISFDDGQHWKQLQLNLPVTPITDLKVHKGDLIASTMGRSFWILDNKELLHQFTKKTTTDSIWLYQPRDAYRVSGGSVLDILEDDDDGSASPTVSGTNPASGLVLYYQLPSSSDSVKVSLEILDENGNLVRSYSDKPDPTFVSFGGGPSANPILSKKEGLNRFIWDLRYPTLTAVPNIFIEGSYQGRKVSPGKFSAKLKVGTTEKTINFSVLADPRINATEAEYKKQENVLALVDQAVSEMHADVNNIRKARKQINDLIEIVEGKTAYKAILDSGKSVVKKIIAWEEKMVQPKAESNDDVINFVNKLSADYIFVKGELDVNIPTVTSGQEQRLAELDAQWKPLQAEYRALIQKDVAGFNALCKQANLEKITLPDAVK